MILRRSDLHQIYSVMHLYEFQQVRKDKDQFFNEHLLWKIKKDYQCFIIFIRMLLFALLWVAVVIAQDNQLNIRTGISQLQLGNIAYASYSIVFKSSLPDSAYNSIVAVNYVSSFSTANGINVSSICPSTGQASMQCTVQSGSPSQFSTVYVSYVASDMGSLLVGSYQHTFAFSPNVTSLSETLTFSPLVNNPYINYNNALFVNFYPFVAGLSSVDADFNLSIDHKQFNALTLEIILSITIQQMHAKSILVTFGYLLFDSSIITVGFYENQPLVPDAIPKGYIYGINGIKSVNSTASTPKSATATTTATAAPNPVAKTVANLATASNLTSNPTPKTTASSLAAGIPLKRLLQASSLPALPMAAPTLASNIPNITAKDPAIIKPNVQNASTVQPGPAYIALNPADFVPDQQSQTAQLLRNSASNATRFRLTPIVTNYTLFDYLMQGDGMIDTNDTIQSLLFEQSVIVPKTQKSAIAGQGPQIFNSLFSSNGFVIMTAADDVDQIYYFEVSPVQEVTPSSSGTKIAAISSIVYYKSAVSNVKQNAVCSRGVLIGFQQKIDYFQQKMTLSCLVCPQGSYLDLSLKTCMPFPIIKSYYNQVDRII